MHLQKSNFHIWIYMHAPGTKDGHRFGVQGATWEVALWGSCDRMRGRRIDHIERRDHRLGPRCQV